MEWSHEQTLKLIGEFQRHRCLWDPQDVAYKRPAVKSDAWVAISEAIGCGLPDAKRKIESLMASFRRERTRTLASPQGTTAPYRSKWFAYESMQYLADSRRTTAAKPEVPVGPEEEPSDRQWTAKTGKASKRKESTEVGHEDEETNAEVSAEPKKSLTIVETDATEASTETEDPMVDSPPPPSPRLREQQSQEAANSQTGAEIDAFCKFIAAKMQNYAPEVSRGVQHAVFEVLMKADNGVFG